MPENVFKIIVPVDFTDASDRAVDLAAGMAALTNARIDLLHIIEDAEEDREKLEKILDSLRAKKIDCAALMMRGKVLETISRVATDGHYTLMIIGTHGVHGIRQNLFGADMLKILRNTGTPSIVVQKGASLRPFRKILLPVGSHSTYDDLVRATTMIGRLYTSEVVIYSISRPQEEPSRELTDNLAMAQRMFTEHGINTTYVNEEMSVYSFGFAKQTLMYAEKENFDLIAMMPYSSIEHAYFANADKERVLNNEAQIPVLCSKGEIET